MASLNHILVWVQMITSAWAMGDSEFLEWTDPVFACIRSNNKRNHDSVDDFNDCQQRCEDADDFLCISIDYNTNSKICRLSIVNSNTVEPQSDFTEPCYSNADNSLYAERRAKDSVAWSVPILACVRGNNARTITGVNAVVDCQQRCEDETGFLCISIDYNNASKVCRLSRVNSDTVDPPGDFTQPCYTKPEDVQYAERSVNVPVQPTTTTPVDKAETVYSKSAVATILTLPFHYTDIIVPVQTTTTMNASTTQTDRQSVGGSPGTVWGVLVVVSAVILVAVIVLFLRYRRQNSVNRAANRGVSNITRSQDGVESYDRAESGLHNVGYQEVDCTPVTNELGHEYAHADCQNSVSTKENNNIGKDDRVLNSAFQSDGTLEHEYAYADADNGTPGAGNDGDAKGQVYNVLYQSASDPGVTPEEGREGADVYSYAEVTSTQTTSVVGTGKADDAAYSPLIPDGGESLSAQATTGQVLDSGADYQCSNVSHESENMRNTPDYMTVLS